MDDFRRADEVPLAQNEFDNQMDTAYIKKGSFSFCISFLFLSLFSYFAFFVEADNKCFASSDEDFPIAEGT